MSDLAKLKFCVHSAAKTLMPTTFLRVEPQWVKENTCAQLLERIFHENGQVMLFNMNARPHAFTPKKAAGPREDDGQDVS
jgi:hypothetical protein